MSATNNVVAARTGEIDGDSLLAANETKPAPPKKPATKNA